MVAPAGAPVSENDSVSAGMSESVALRINDFGVSSFVVIDCEIDIGETLTSLTVIVIVSESDSIPSDTMTSNVEFV